MIKLSILIPTLNSRSEKLKTLVDKLLYQIGHRDVQIIWLGDNKFQTVGSKRNDLLKLAKGDFFCFIDDDDDISEAYIDELLDAIRNNPTKTVITFEGSQTTNGKEDLPFTYDVDFGRNFKKTIEGIRYKCMLPDHLCVWNKSKVSVVFPNSSLGEDHFFAKKMAMTYAANDQFHIKKTLYLYNYNRYTSECPR